MIWLLRDIDLLSTLLRAANLSFEALLLGGIVYLLAVARPAQATAVQVGFVCRGIRWAALALALSEVVTVTLSGASLLGDSDLHLRDLLHTSFFQAGLSAALLAMLLVGLCAPQTSQSRVMIPLSLLLLARHRLHQPRRSPHGSPFAAGSGHRGSSSGNSGMDRRHALPADFLGTRRHCGGSPLHGAALFLDGADQRRRPGSWPASVMAWFYVGTWNGLYGTSYGVLLLAKIYLLLVMLLDGRGQLAGGAAAQHSIRSLCWRGCGDLPRQRLGWDSPPFWPLLRCLRNRLPWMSPTRSLATSIAARMHPELRA